MKESDHITGVKEASDVLNWDEKSIRASLQQGKLTFGTAIRGIGNNYTYYIDKKALYKCASGDKELFRS